MADLWYPQHPSVTTETAFCDGCRSESPVQLIPEFTSMPDNDESLGEQQTYEGGARPVDSSDRSLGDQSTFGGGADSSLSDIGGLTGDADLDMEIVDLSRYEVQETLGKGGVSGLEFTFKRA